MKFLRLLCLLPALVILLATCKEAGAPTDANGNPTGNVTTTLAGIVTDETGQPVSGVAVIANGKNAVTDKYGTFMIQNASVPGNRCFILCKKNGYFTGSRAEVPKSGGITELRLTLQSSAPGYTVNSSSGGTVSIGTASVKFPPSAFVTSDGKPFTGTVKVAAKHLDPSQSSFYNSFSGDMTARRTDGTQTELLSYGVLRVRLTDDAGNELKLAAGKTATLTYPIAPSQQKTAPASMPLWYFDEALGMWKEEGVASKTGDFYTGDVSHFTDWNCDVPAKTGIVKGRVMCNNDGVAGIYVTVGQRKAITDSSGYFTCRVAANTDFTISINATVNGGFTAPDVLVSAVSAGEERVVTLQLTTCPAYISGVIVDCNNKHVSGTVVVSYADNNVVHYTTNGEFKIRVPLSVNLLIEATSYNGFQSQIQTVGKLISGEIKDIGSLLACTGGSSGSDFSIDFGTATITKTVISNDGSMIAIEGFTKDVSLTFTRVYDVKSGVKLCEFNIAKQDNLSLGTEVVNFSDDGTKLLIRWRTDSALVVNPRNGFIIQKFGNIYHSFMLPDGSAIIASSKQDNTEFAMYSMADGSKIKGIAFNEVGYWTTIGVNSARQIILLGAKKKSIDSSGDLCILYWDIASNTKISENTFPNRQYNLSNYYGCAFSQDFSVVSLTNCCDLSNFFVDFYNTQTGVRLNSVSYFYSQDQDQSSNLSIGLANDLTFVAQENQSNPPIIYDISNKKALKSLSLPSVIGLYRRYTYSANSQYLAGIQRYPSNSVRVWKVK